MQHLWFLKYIVTLFLFFNTVAFAQNNFPTGDQFWTEDGRSMLQARCMPTENSNEDIDCEMITTIFLPKAWPDELNQSLEKGLHSEIFDDKGKLKIKNSLKVFAQNRSSIL